MIHRTRPSVVAATLAALLCAAALGACGTSDTDADSAATDRAAAADSSGEGGGTAIEEGATTEAEGDNSDSNSNNETAGDTDGSEAGDEPDTDDEPDTADAADGAEGEVGATTVALVDSDYLGSYNLVDEAFGTMVTVTVNGDTRSIQTNAIPDHETGEFPNSGNPNTISAQDLGYDYPLTGTYTGDATFAMVPGVAVNGVSFEPGTAETVTCGSGETYRIEALQDLYNLGLDFNNAHVQPNGKYHYHGVSGLLVDAYATDDDLVHVGFAADGFLIYYSKSGAYSSGYALSTEARTGTDCVASGPAGGDGVDIAGTTADGTYGSDWVHSPDNGDLDSCNGTTIDGQYAYLITDEYPYIGRCLNGEYAGGQGPGGDAPGGDQNAGAPGGDQNAGGTPGGGGQGAPPDLTEAAAALGVTVAELQAALGGPPPDFGAAAETLGITVDELLAVLPGP
ncbi:MAG: YHYH protein [Actinomycetota bacterium]